MTFVDFSTRSAFVTSIGRGSFPTLRDPIRFSRTGFEIENGPIVPESTLSL